MPLIVGERIGQYKILSHLGAGGMGEVYLAQDERLRRKVALKPLFTDVTRNAEWGGPGEQGGAVRSLSNFFSPMSPATRIGCAGSNRKRTRPQLSITPTSSLSMKSDNLRIRISSAL